MSNKKPKAILVSALVLASSLFFPAGLRADPAEESEADEPSLVGQPGNVLFSGAVGTSFKVTARAVPTRVQAEDPFVLTLRVAAVGPWQKPPRRLDLRKLPRPFDRVARQFAIDKVKKDQPDRQPAAGVWEFDYRLRPNSADVKEVPALPFTYYNPNIPFQARRWQTAYTAPVPLTVTPRAAVQPAEVEAPSKPPQRPDRLYELATGKAVLRHEEPFSLPGWLVLVMLSLAPPVLCAVWYVIWRRRHPDADRLARRQRSRAARQALKALQAVLPAADGAARARAAAAVVTAYLQERFDFPTIAPAPFEVAAYLERRKLSPCLATEAAEFFRACEAAQFAPDDVADRDGFRDAAEKLIVALECAKPTADEGPSEARATKSAVNTLAAPAAVTAIRLILVVGLCLPALACPWPVAFAAEPSDEQLLAQAEAAFSRGVAARGTPEEAAYFAAAAEQYEALHRPGSANAALFRNEGNAYLLAGDLPRAILAYRRGLRLDPNDRDLRADLAYARTQVAFPDAGTFGRPERDPLPPWLPRPTALGWFVLMLGFYALGWVGLTRWRMTFKRGFLWGGVVAFVAAAFFGAGLAATLLQSRRDREQPLVVVARDGVFLHRGNGPSYPRSYDTPLNRAVEARRLYARGNWLQVELAGGEVGWLPEQAVVLDLP